MQRYRTFDALVKALQEGRIITFGNYILDAQLSNSYRKGVRK